VLRNKSSGNGYVRAAGPNFGVGLLAGATDNFIEDNVITGNVTGIRIVAAAVRNVFRGNVIAGNPPILVSNNAPENSPFGFDILNLSALDANTFENNLCITSMNAPCASRKPTADVIPIATSVTFDFARARRGGPFNVTFSGNDLTSATYFDVRFRAPGATSEDVAFNWQQGFSGTHTVPQNAILGDWSITGVRAHQDANDHTGPFAPVQVTFFVFVSPF